MRPSKRFVALLAGVVLLLPAFALAEDVSSAEPSFVWAILKMIAALAICLGLLLGGLHVLRRLKIVTPLNDGGLINVLATKALGPKRYISVVEVAGELLVVGVAEGGINLLTRIEERSSGFLKRGGLHVANRRRGSYHQEDDI